VDHLRWKYPPCKRYVSESCVASPCRLPLSTGLTVPVLSSCSAEYYGVLAWVVNHCINASRVRGSQTFGKLRSLGPSKAESAEGRAYGGIDKDTE